jgi:asparagine synthase (glutamine-hydrolysing)
MCGIAGIIGRLAAPNRAALKRMNDAMMHRGPDGDGYWESHSDERGFGVMLAHRRLSILDLTAAAAQPMVDAITGHVVVFNGEIYNYIELRTELTAHGQVFHSTGDTEVMLRAVGLHGPQTIRRLRGMFAFAVWDPRKRNLLLARDPLGIKPLYLARNPDPGGDWVLIFASEVRAILASRLLGNPRLNPHAVASIAWNGFMITPETAIIGVESIWPGQFRIFDSLGKEQVSELYWTMPKANEASRVGESELAQVLDESVHLHLASDVPLGIFLSGGVDSSAVANVAYKTSRSSVHTFTLTFEEQEYNEGDIARRIAKAIGTQHREIVLTEQQFVTQLDAALDSLDQPTFDGLNSYYMSQAVGEAGFKVALVGTGGDELFGGYTSFRSLPALLRWSKGLNCIPAGVVRRLASLVSYVLQPTRGSVPQQTRWAKLPDMVSCGGDLLALYQLAYALFLPEFQRQLVTVASKEITAAGLPAEMHSRLLCEIRSRSPLSAISVMEQRLFLGERLLRDTDATSMAASIEVRLPLVDHLLLEKVNGLGDRERYQPLQKKSMLRRIGLQGLDAKIFEKPKTGFVLPYDRWLRKGLGKVLDQTMCDAYAIKLTGLNPEAVQRLWKAFLDGAPGLYWSRVWAIYVLIRWCHKHGAYI